MKTLPKPLKILINNLKRLPGIGEKTAERLSYYIIKQDDEYLNEFSHILSCIKHEIIFHGICGFFCDANNKCLICDDATRQNDLICVIKEAKDVFSFEKAGFKGLYHILGGLLSPLDNIGPSDIKIDELANRINDNINEVIIALDGSIEGDATTLYISNLLSKHNVIVSKLARGIPMGSQLDYIDDITLMRSLQDRRGM